MGGLTKIFILNEPPSETVQTAKQLASIGLTWEDAQALRKEVEHAVLVDPITDTRQQVRYGEYRKSQSITAATPDFAHAYKFYPDRGRFLIESDLASSARVCVLGDTAARRYFGNEDPLGKTLYLGDVGFRVVGVMERKEFYFREDDHNALEWMNRLTFIPLTALYSRFTGDPDKKVNYINVAPRRGEGLRGVQPRRASPARAGEGPRLRHRLSRQRHRGSDGWRDRHHEHHAGLLPGTCPGGGDP
jgi:hypothetical protein